MLTDESESNVKLVVVWDRGQRSGGLVSDSLLLRVFYLPGHGGDQQERGELEHHTNANNRLIY